MAHVIVLDSINEDIFVCGLCKCVFNSLEVFLEHKRLQCTPELIKNISVPVSTVSVSSEVPTGSLSANNLEPTLHQEYRPESQCEAATLSLPCPVCGKVFKNTKTHKVHMKSHELKPYQCLICGRCFNQNSHLQRHYLTHKVWPESLSETTAKSSEVDILSYSCPYCKLVFSNYHIFRSHLKNHQAVKKYKCIQRDCIYFFETVESLLQHVCCAHVSPVYFCYICEKPFASLENIAAHQQDHNTLNKEDTQGKQYKCLQCDAVFKKPEKLSLHMLTENHKKMCIHCNKTFASDKRLRLHLQIHRKIKPYQCNICNASFHMKKYLSNHMLKHGRKEFKCVICENTFKRHDLLQRHMKLHESSKLLKCPFKDTLDCKREFSRKDKLKLHVKSHTKVLQCSGNNNSQNITVDDG